MATSTRLDREQKSVILKEVMYYIYAHSDKRLKTQLEEIITKNTALVGKGDLFLFYKGNHYMCEGAYRTERKSNQLVSILKPYMDEWIADQAAFIDERSLVNAYLASVFNASHNVSDYTRILPDCLHPALRPFLHLRNRHEPISEEQVQAIQEKNKRAVSMIKQRLLLNIIV